MDLEAFDSNPQVEVYDVGEENKEEQPEPEADIIKIEQRAAEILEKGKILRDGK